MWGYILTLPATATVLARHVAGQWVARVRITQPGTRNMSPMGTLGRKSSGRGANTAPAFLAPSEWRGRPTAYTCIVQICEQVEEVETVYSDSGSYTSSPLLEPPTHKVGTDEILGYEGH